MTKQAITLEEGINVLREVQRKFPDFVYLEHYGTCQYVNEVIEEGVPNHCVVGQFLFELGKSDEVIGMLNQSASISGCQNREAVEDYLGLCLDDRLFSILQSAQDKQDGSSSTTWFDAIEEAINPAPLFDYYDDEPF